MIHYQVTSLLNADRCNASYACFTILLVIDRNRLVGKAPFMSRERAFSCTEFIAVNYPITFIDAYLHLFLGYESFPM